MDYLESTMGTLLFDILICWGWYQLQTSIVTLLQLSCIHRRSKVSIQNSQAGQHDESRHNFKVVYIHQLRQYASLLSVLLLNRF